MGTWPHFRLLQGNDHWQALSITLDTNKEPLGEGFFICVDLSYLDDPNEP